VSGHKGDLARLGAPKPVAAEAENFAALAEVFGADKGRVKAGAVLVLPFVQTALLEFGSIWCLSFAFRRGAQVKVEAAAVKAITERPAGEITDAELDELRRLYAKPNLSLSNDDLAKKLGCSKSESSKRASKAVDVGLLTRVRHGREVRLQLASAGHTLN
jgi:DNA-binding MarR family transcriptional regulator